MPEIVRSAAQGTLRFLQSFGGRRKGALFSRNVRLSAAIQGTTSIDTVAFNEVLVLRKSLLSGGFAREAGLQRGHQALQENQMKFCTLGAEFCGGPVESAPAW